MQIRTPETSKSEATKKTPSAGKVAKRTPGKTVSAVKIPKKVEMADKTPIKTEPVTEALTEIEVDEKTPAEVADSKAAESSPTIAEKPVAKTEEFKAEEHASATKDTPPPMKTAVKTLSVAKSVTPNKTSRKIKSPSVTTTSPGKTLKIVTLGKEEEKSQTQHCEMPMASKDKQEPGNDTLMKDEEKDKVAQMDDVNKAENVRDKMEEEAIEDHKGEETKAGEYGVNEEMENCGKEERFEEAGYEECRENDREADEAVGMEEEQDQMSALSNERRLKKELEIFVGGVDWDATEEDVKKPFEKVGEVVEVRLPRNNMSKKNKGFAFVKFANKEQVNRALSELKSPIIHGKQCRVAPSEDNDTLFLGNICNTWTKLAIKEKLKDYGIEGVESITLVPDPQKEGVSRGFAFVEFSCHEDAMVAYKRLQKPDVIFGHAERTAKVAFAEPLPVPDPEVMAQVKCVFVDGLPSYWDEDRVREQFKGYGEIERVTLARNMTTAKRKDFAFVNFTSHEAALACIKGLNNSELGDAGKTKTKARARLANPAPKTQAVKGGMRGGFRVAGRGFARGGRPFSGTGGFQRGRAFHPRGRGRSGRFPFADDNDVERFQPEFRGRRPFGRRGGRRGAFGSTYGEPVEEFLDQADISSRLDMERPRHRDTFQSSRRLHSPEGDFSRSFGSQDAGGESDQYYRGGYGTKRRYSIMDHESAYMDLEPTRSRLRLEYDYSDSLSHRMRYQDTLGTSDSQYSRDYYGSDNYGSRYSSLYGDARLMGDRYYY